MLRCIFCRYKMYYIFMCTHFQLSRWAKIGWVGCRILLAFFFHFDSWPWLESVQVTNDLIWGEDLLWLESTLVYLILTSLWWRSGEPIFSWEFQQRFPGYMEMHCSELVTTIKNHMSHMGFLKKEKAEPGIIMKIAGASLLSLPVIVLTNRFGKGSDERIRIQSYFFIYFVC
jgi:hypothetical protein